MDRIIDHIIKWLVYSSLFGPEPVALKTKHLDKDIEDDNPFYIRF